MPNQTFTCSKCGRRIQEFVPAGKRRTRCANCRSGDSEYFEDTMDVSSDITDSSWQAEIEDTGPCECNID